MVINLDVFHFRYKEAHKLAPDHNFRHMYWDVYPKASASQVHPHLHILLASNEYYGT